MSDEQDELSPSAADESRQLLDELISRSLAYRNSQELKELLDFTCKFPHIAPYNAMLLHVQNPGIQYALRAGEWARWGRRVKPASRPYVILRTMGPVAFVFDLSDTEPIDPKHDRIPKDVKNPFPTKGDPPQSAMANLRKACEKLGIKVECRDFATGLAGEVMRAERAGYQFHVILNSKHTPTQQLGTLVHELAHVFCGHLGKTEAGFWHDRRNAEVPVRELEAEAVAYLVTERLHLDIGSVKYLAGYLKDDSQLPNYSLDAVLKAAGKIEEMIAGRFRLKKEDRMAFAVAKRANPSADVSA